MIKIKKLHPNAIIPKFAKEGDAGRDLFTLEDTIIGANETKVIPTGIAIQLPKDKEVQIRPRSGVSLNGCKGCFEIKHIGYMDDKWTLQTKIDYREVSPYLRVILGTCDSNYRGEIGVITYNQEDYDVLIPKGTRLAQMVVNTVVTEEMIEVDELDDSIRGESGFGSSGIGEIK